jgi:cytochrome c553
MKNTTSALLLGAALVSASALSQVAADTTSRPAARIAQDLCAGCHGPNLVGGSAPNLIDSIWVHGSSDEDIRKSIRDGFPQKGMVGYGSQLSEAEQTSMISYIRSQSRRFAFGQIPAPSPPDSVVLKSEKQEFRLETVAASLDTPWGLSFLPNGDMLVTERPGALRLIRKGKLVADPIRDTPKPYVRQDAGYFDVSVHPDHAKNGWIYLA